MVGPRRTPCACLPEPAACHLRPPPCRPATRLPATEHLAPPPSASIASAAPPAPIGRAGSAEPPFPSVAPDGLPYRVAGLGAGSPERRGSLRRRHPVPEDGSHRAAGGRASRTASSNMLAGSCRQRSACAPSRRPRGARARRPILRASERASQLTKKLPTFSRKRPGARGSGRHHEIIHDAIALCSAEVAGPEWSSRPT